MANILILGVYATKTALDTAHASDNTNGDTYIVGSKIPYNLYAWDGSKFVKGDPVSNDAGDLDVVEIDDVTEDIAVEKLFSIKFKGEDGKTLMIRKGLHLGEIQFYVPTDAEDFPDTSGIVLH